MTTTTSTQYAADSKYILELKLDSQGNVTRKATRLGRKDTIEGTLLAQLYPGIRVARVSVPAFLDRYEESVVENAMAKIVYGGMEYKLVGASGSAKDGKFYFVDTKHSDAIAERFQHWPEAAITYFSILVSDCKAVLEESMRILIVEDHVLGTNDCRGWLRESLYKKMGLGLVFAQFRLAFDFKEPKQAKGALKPLSDALADKMGVDIVLPESSCKPKLKGGVKFLPHLGTSGRMFAGPAVLGIKQWAHVSEFQSSYSLTEHACEESLQREIMPFALEEIRKVTKAWEEGDYTGLLEVLGRIESREDTDDDQETSENTSVPLDGSSSPLDEKEYELSDAILLADRSGTGIKYPYISNQINRKLAWYFYRMLTSGGFKMPAFALADDGILVEHNGKILSASDWIPEDAAITSLSSDAGLTVRYPIRMQEDLLPVRHITSEELHVLVRKALNANDLTEEEIHSFEERQLCMEGIYILHSVTAAKNGGDFDFDQICVMPSDLFSKFYAGRLAYGNHYSDDQGKTKLVKAKAPWWNMSTVAMKARGNKIGRITDLKTSCLAAGRRDLAYKLVKQLQNALDSLKHKVTVDEDVIAEIAKEVPMAPWLQYKRVTRVTDLPEHLDVADTDKIGRLYNYLRKEIGSVVAEKLDIANYRGLFQGQKVTREMFVECELVNSIYAEVVSKIHERTTEITEVLDRTEKDWKAFRSSGSENKKQRKEVLQARNKAQGAMKEHDEETRDQLSSLNIFVHYWSQGKQDRLSWAQALHTVVTNGKGTGAVFCQAFGQELVDAFATMTGGKRVKVRMPKVIDGYIRFDDQQRAFLVERIPGVQDGEKSIFLFQYKGNRDLIFENTSMAPPTPAEACS